MHAIMLLLSAAEALFQLYRPFGFTSMVEMPPPTTR
jgi:hypothetical protein